MRNRGTGLGLGFVLTVLAACAGTVEPAGPSEKGLRASFADQIAAIDLVEEFRRDGDEITFTRLDGAGDSIAWRVRIDEARVEPNDDPTMPYRGVVRSSWFLNGAPVGHTETTSELPMWILDAGLGQQCWALWIEESAAWDW